LLENSAPPNSLTNVSTKSSEQNEIVSWRGIYVYTWIHCIGLSPGKTPQKINRRMRSKIVYLCTGPDWDMGVVQAG
jgi:hypothetical protein